MGTQACSDLDKKLAQLYAEKVTVNLDQKSSISPDVFWQSMQVIAVNNKAFINFKK